MMRSSRDDPGPRSPYLNRRRRMLLDMQIADWDSRFLADYDPKELARRYEIAGVNAVMVPYQSHMGLTYGPTSVARQHPGLGGRDAVGELIAELRGRDILVCGEVSVAFDAHAFTTHPEWQLVPARESDEVPKVSYWPRHLAVCMNQAGYQDYEARLIQEMLERYAFDALLLDMMFWPGICVCGACRARWAVEHGDVPIPDRVDWASPSWAAFQGARERWTEEFAGAMRRAARDAADIPVYQNFAVAMFQWSAGKSLRAFSADDFLGADLYGDTAQQLFGCKLMLGFSAQHPPEFMTASSRTLRDHSTIKTEAELRTQVLAATALSCASLVLTEVDPQGTAPLAVYEQVGRVFESIEPFEPFLGGSHVADVGVYYSTSAAVDLNENGTLLRELDPSPPSETPHLRAAIGAVHNLQRMHAAAAVVTADDLDELSRFRVMIVPELTRITSDEENAFRAFVRNGGCMYASGHTSLLSADGSRHGDFRLGDVLGVELDEAGHDRGAQLFMRPSSALARLLAPQSHISWRWKDVGHDVPRLAEGSPGTPLATLALPYGYPATGTRLDTKWASVYSDPPWDETAHPTVVEHRYGEGHTIYCCMPIESARAGPSSILFRALVAGLLGARRSISADAPPTVWIEAFDQVDRSRYVVSVLDSTTDDLVTPTKASVSLAPPADRQVTSARYATGGPIVFDRGDDGSIRFEVSAFPFALVLIDYISS